MAMKSIRLSPQTLLVLDRFVRQPSAWLYGYELSRETGLKSGTLYPILMRLARHEMLEKRWVQTAEGVPPRHTYRLTAKGVELVAICGQDEFSWQAGRCPRPVRH
jgi:DNA-binding HxlR family transcriptional regulator